ncbi:hypothetical protein Q8A67_002028 [Cirrhinus molitorella]|uniref:Uncharacterized protein n=1 Tax=Cirrhinus molitorella TaxID=172907 RepID=A0AA88TXI6_9TELE|nr:hypothetical protein Q8A67_002028 [Cirrhinus molitorella]
MTQQVNNSIEGSCFVGNTIWCPLITKKEDYLCSAFGKTETERQRNEEAVEICQSRYLRSDQQHTSSAALASPLNIED